MHFDLEAKLAWFDIAYSKLELQCSLKISGKEIFQAGLKFTA